MDVEWGTECQDWCDGLEDIGYCRAACNATPWYNKCYWEAGWCSGCSSCPSQQQKQLNFKAALFAAADALDSIEPNLFFLGDGTALGAAREGQFIRHTGDIDLGIFSNYNISSSAREDAINSVPRNRLTLKRPRFNTTTDPNANEHSNAANNRRGTPRGRRQLQVVDAMQKHKFRLLGTTTVESSRHSRYITEHKFLYEPTKVKLDIFFFNVTTDNKMETYIDAAACSGKPRKMCVHQTSFSIPKPTIFMNRPFLTLGKMFLEETYGKDWRTPKIFTYNTGIERGLYKSAQ